MYSIFQKGFIEVVCGPMFAGKTEELIRRIRRLEYSKQKVLVFKPKIDNRYNSKNQIISHNLSTKPSIVIDKSVDILSHLNENVDAVVIDEAQFFDDGIVEVCNALANKGIRVIVAGLDMDYKGVPFKNMANLMATAEYVTKVHAICPKTGGLAQYSYRKTKSKKRILLGKGDEYMPLSRAAYIKKTFKRTNKTSGKK